MLGIIYFLPCQISPYLIYTFAPARQKMPEIWFRWNLNILWLLYLPLSIRAKFGMRRHPHFILVGVYCRFNYYYYNRFTTLCPGLPRWVGTRRINHSGFCWSRHDRVAEASADTCYIHPIFICIRFTQTGQRECENFCHLLPSPIGKLIIASYKLQGHASSKTSLQQNSAVLKMQANTYWPVYM